MVRLTSEDPFIPVAKPLVSTWSHGWISDYLNEFARLVCLIAHPFRV
jgi:hypothetical protein